MATDARFLIFRQPSLTYEGAPSRALHAGIRLRHSTPDQTATGRTDRSSSRLWRNADRTACSMSLRLTTCDNIRRTVIGGHMSLQGMPASDWGGSSQRCWLREGSGHDRRRKKNLRSGWTIRTEGALLFLPQL